MVIGFTPASRSRPPMHTDLGTRNQTAKKLPSWTCERRLVTAVIPDRSQRQSTSADLLQSHHGLVDYAVSGSPVPPQLASIDAVRVGRIKSHKILVYFERQRGAPCLYHESGVRGHDRITRNALWYLEPSASPKADVKE